MTVDELVKKLQPLGGLQTNVVDIGEPFYSPDGIEVEMVDGKPVGVNFVKLIVE